MSLWMHCPITSTISFWIVLEVERALSGGLSKVLSKDRICFSPKPYQFHKVTFIGMYIIVFCPEDGWNCRYEAESEGCERGKDDGSEPGSVVKTRFLFSQLSWCKSTCDYMSFPVSFSRVGADWKDILEVDREHILVWVTTVFDEPTEC